MIGEGKRVEKCNSLPDDGHQDGDQGKVVSAVPIPEDKMADIAGDLMAAHAKGDNVHLNVADALYFVEWDDLPGIPVAIAGNRIREI